MKKYIISILFIALLFITSVYAQDIVLEAKVKNITTNIDDYGREYVQILIEQEQIIDGQRYIITMPIICFDESAIQAKTLKPNQLFKAIVNISQYTAIALIN